MGVEDGDGADGAVVAHTDDQVDVVRKAGDDHLDNDALFAAVHADDAAVGACVLLLGVFAAAGKHIAQNRVKHGLFVGLGGAGKGRVRAEEHNGAHEDYGDGYKQLFHFPSPPFMTPKRLGGIALSSAHAKAFMIRMA